MTRVKSSYVSPFYATGQDGLLSGLYCNIFFGICIYNFENLLKKYPEVLKCIPLLLAVRANEIYCQDKNGGCLYQFNGFANDIDSYKYFMRETGLFDLLENHIVNNLVDYATGVETGLDSNGRKNRGGHLMEDLVEKYLQEAGFVKDKNSPNL